MSVVKYYTYFSHPYKDEQLVIGIGHNRDNRRHIMININYDYNRTEYYQFMR